MQRHIPVHGTQIPADIWTVRSWALGHHAGIITYPHHDAEGAATFAIVQSGVKNWTVIDVKDAQRETLPAFLTEISSNDASLLDYMDCIKAETIHLHPGDLL